MEMQFAAGVSCANLVLGQPGAAGQQGRSTWPGFIQILEPVLSAPLPVDLQFLAKFSLTALI